MAEIDVQRLRELAHDLNNALTTVLMRGESLMEDTKLNEALSSLRDGARTRANIEKLHKGTILSAELTREILLLARSVEAPAPAPTPEPQQEVVGNSILLMEDQPDVREAVCAVLSAIGHEVLAPLTVESAVGVFEKTPRIGLLITDVSLPGMSGPELASRLLAIRPNVKILLISGYDAALDSAVIAGVKASFLAKPFSPQQLVAKVKEVMG